MMIDGIPSSGYIIITMVFVGNISIILYSIHGVYKPMVISMVDLQDPIHGGT